MDFLLRKDCESEHTRDIYSTIYGKIIYPVAENPLNRNNKSKQKYRFKFKKIYTHISRDGYYRMIR